MLSSLHIENIAVIKRADIDFPSGFCVLTGETGAGKSILVDSINLLLGSTFSRDMIRSGETTAVVGALFDRLSEKTRQSMAELGFDDDEIYMQRTVTQDGKSTVKCNGRTIPRSLQRTIMSGLIHIHGQHDNEQMLLEEYHLSYLDDYAQTAPELEAYRTQNEKLSEVRQKLNALQRRAREKARMTELLTYQIHDIEAVSPKEGEEESLLQDKKKLQNREKITKQARLIYRALYRNEKGYSASDLLEKAADAFLQLSDVMTDAPQLSEKLNSMRYDIQDLSQTVRDFADTDDGEDPSRKLDRIETRLEAISKLKKKYGSTVTAVLAFLEKSKNELAEMESFEITEKEYKEQAHLLYHRTIELAEVLSAKRAEAAKKLTAQLEDEFRFLDMNKVRFDVSIERESNEDGTVKTGENGIDRVRFLIATNPGEPFKPLSKIASGGEISRIMLAAKCVLLHRDRDATLIFDEVDAGVSGKTSHKIGTKLRMLGHGNEDRQVFCVTHSAQIAAQADTHFLIEKKEDAGRVYTTITQLDENGRIEELARITAGIHITDTARAGARELLHEGQLQD